MNEKICTNTSAGRIKNGESPKSWSYWSEHRHKGSSAYQCAAQNTTTTMVDSILGQYCIRQIAENKCRWLRCRWKSTVIWWVCDDQIAGPIFIVPRLCSSRVNSPKKTNNIVLVKARFNGSRLRHWYNMPRMCLHYSRIWKYNSVKEVALSRLDILIMMHIPPVDAALRQLKFMH
jgi:hypothetical protein